MGDAAHVHSPIGGQGMNTGLQDAYNLAWKLSLVHHKIANKKLLLSYHEERHANAKKLLTVTKFLTNMLAPKSSFIKWIRPFFMKQIISKKFAQKKMMSTLSQIGVHYHHMSLSKTYHASLFSKEGRAFNKGPKAGDRAPNASIKVLEEEEIHTAYDLFKGSHFHGLIFLSGMKDLSSQQGQEVKRYTEFDKIKFSRYIKNLVVTEEEFLENEKEFLKKSLVWEGYF